MRQHLKNKLTDYATFTACILLLSGKADAEVVYTDKDPDVVLDTDGDYYTLDVDSNSISDFHFIKSTISYSTTYYNIHSFQGLKVRPYASNAIAGNSHYYYPYGVNLFFFAYALDSNYVIDSTIGWKDYPNIFFCMEGTDRRL